MESLAFVLAGFGVGAIVGMTGVGGGSLMTPILIFFFGVKPHLAVGTDLLFAAVTKAGGSVSLARRGLVVERMADNPAQLVNRSQADDTHTLPHPSVLGASEVMGRENVSLFQHRAPAPPNPPDIAHRSLAECRLRPLGVMAEIKDAACLG